MRPELSQSTVNFDRSCPVCLADIGYNRRRDEAGALCFVDISEAGAVTPQGVSQQRAMKPFHVRGSDGRVLSGAAARVEIWTRLPRWRRAARAASPPGALAVLALGHRILLLNRPFSSRLVGRVPQLRAVADGARRG